MQATMRILNTPPSGTSVCLGSNPDEYQFITVADVQEPPHYIPMHDEPSIEVLAQRFVEKASGVLGKAAELSASGDTVTVVWLDEETVPVIESNSPDLEITPFS